MPIWGHLGSQGSTGHFHQNCSNLSILNSLTIILKHMHQLETPTYVVGSNVNHGSLGILQERAGFVSFQRHTILVLTLPLSAARYCFLRVSFFFSGNTSTANNVNISWLISTKLGHNNPYLRGIMSHDQQGVKGHVGSEGSKRSFSLKILQILSHSHVTYTYEASTCPVLYLCFFSRSEV